MLPLRMLGPFMLLLALCDADTSCPTELNPLTLDPPEITGEYGESFYVNCTSSEESHQGMYWKLGNTKYDIEDENYFIPWQVSLSDWDVTAECRIKLSDSFECSRDLEITIYKPPDIVTLYASDLDRMVEGREYLLNCYIINVAPVQNLKVRWYRGNETIYTQTFNETRVTPLNVSSTLRVLADRLDNGALFRCEAELDLGPKAPKLILTTSSPHTAVVLYKPVIQDCPDRSAGVEHEFRLDMLSCQADGNPPPHVQWFYQGKPINASEPLTRTQAGKYTAVVGNSIGSSNTSVDVTIEYAPDLKSYADDVFVSVGNDITLTCGAEGNPPPVFKWTCDGVITLENTDKFNVTGVTTSATYNCTTTNYLGSVTKQIHVHVMKTTTTATPAAVTAPEAYAHTEGCPLVLMPAEAVVRFGDPASLHCSTSSADDLGMNLESAFRDTEVKTSPTVPWTTTKPKELTRGPNCYVTLGDNQCFEIPNITLSKLPDTESVSSVDPDLMVEGREYLLNCDIISEAPVQNLKVRWYRGNETIYTQTFNETRVTPLNVSSTLRELADRLDNGALFRCEAELDLGPKAPKLILTTSSPHTAVVLYKPVIQACPDRSAGVEHEFRLDMLSCQADGNPPPLVQWFYQGKPINASEPLTRTQAGKYTAVVGNSIGSSNTSVDVTVEYAPDLKSYADDVFVSVGNDITLTCGAEGNPPPVFKWTCDGVNTLENTDKFNVTGVTTSATYNCTATNYLGSVTKQIHVHVMKTTTTATPAAVTAPEAYAHTEGCPLVLMPAEAVVRFGDPASLHCSTSSADDLGMNLEAAFRDKEVKTSPTVPWTTTKPKELTRGPNCYVTLGDNQCFEIPNITLSKLPDTESVSTVDPDLMVEGREYLLNCDIISEAPVQNLKVRWYRGNETIYTQTFNETRVTTLNVSSTLRVLADRRDNGALFRCEAELDLGPKAPKLTLTTSSPHTAVVLYKPVIQACPDRSAGVEHEFRLDMLSCQADGNPPPHVQWFYQGKQINASEPLTRTQAGKYTAVFGNSIGSSNTSVNVTVEYAPDLKSYADDVFVSVGNDITLTCGAEGNPPPVFKWTCDGVNTLENTDKFNVTGVTTSATYNCTATNYLGSVTKQIHVHVMKTTTTATPAAVTAPEAYAHTEGCPLVLMPAEAVVRFGDPASLHCSTSSADDLGMNLEAAFRDTEVKTSPTVPWTTTKPKELTRGPNCYVTLRDNQCFEIPNITLSKLPDTESVSTVDPDLMVEGREYLLNCDIISEAPVQNLKVRWYRGNETIYTQVFNETHVTTLNVSSTLRELAERRDNGALFRCEAELDLGPKAPKLILTTSSPHTAVVLYKPVIQDCPDRSAGVEHEFSLDMLSCQADGNPPPLVQWFYQGKQINASEPLTRTQAGKYTAVVGNSIGSSNTSVDVTIEYVPDLKSYADDVFVSVGNDITLTCGAEGNPPPVFKWTCDGVNTLANTDKFNVTGVTTSATYNCTATNYLGSVTKQIHVHVMKTTTTATPAAVIAPEAYAHTEGCPLVLMPAEAVVRFGDPASLHCSTSSADDLGISLEAAFRDTEAKTSPTVPWTTTKPKELTRGPNCYVTLRDNQCFEIPNITLSKLPDTESVSTVDPDLMVEGREYLLNCDIISEAPVQNLKVMWYRGNETIYTQTFNETRVTTLNVSSTLRELAERRDNGALFRCEAELDLGPKAPKLILTTSSPHTAVVLYKPVIQACPDRSAGVEHEFSLDMLSCQADGNPPPLVQWFYQGKQINASEPLTRTQAGKYTAVFGNSIGSSNTSVDVTVEYGPSFTCNDRYEFQEDDELQTFCEPKGMPPPVITWFKDGAKAAPPKRWTRHNSGKYILIAISKHGIDNHTLYIDVMYAPVFKMGNYSAEVTPGEDVTFNCSAEGNPPPVMHWHYTSAVNVMETTGGRQKNITITGATSANAGSYVCVATNRVGTVTRAVTLMMKGKTSAASSVVIWASLIMFIAVIILILFVFHHNRWKKHRQYSFVPEEAKDGSDRSIPMTTKSYGVGYD